MYKLRYSPDQPRDDHGRFGEDSLVSGVTNDISGPMEHTIGTPAMFALVRVGDKLITKAGTKYTVKEKSSDTTLKVFDHANNVMKDVSKTEVDKELTWGSRSLRSRIYSPVLHERRWAAIDPLDIKETLDTNDLPITILLFRHGQTVSDANNEFCGWTDEDMDDEGFAAVKEAAEEVLSGLTFTKVFSDDLQRTFHTAEVALQYATDVTAVIVNQGARTWDVGDLAGKKKTPENLAEKQYYVDHPKKVPPGSQESLKESKQRWIQFLLYVASTMVPGETSLIACHSSNFKTTGQEFGAKMKVWPSGVVQIKISSKGIDAKILRKGSVEQMYIDDRERAKTLSREIRYSPDQPRDDHGRFGTGDANYDTNNIDLQVAIDAWRNSDDPAEGSTPDDEFVSMFEQTAQDAVKAVKAGGASANQNPIVNGIRNEEFKGTIYRGLAISKEDPITGWKVGQTVQLMPQSFSKDKEVAGEFAINAKSDDKPIAIFMQITGGAGIDISHRGDKMFWREKEVISGGTFTVRSIAPIGNGFKIKLKQTGVF
jgi:broad specificity phosphatase PhoE